MKLLLTGLLMILFAVPALAQHEFSPSSVEKGVLLVASPSLSDPNFHQSVLLIIEHGRGGTVGLILNRPTNVLVSEVLPDFTVLKRTTHRLFTGGPVERTQLVLLFRLTQLLPDTRPIVDGIYVGTPRVLERIMTQPKPTETFRAFAGFAGWAPGQLEHEMLEGAWGVLPLNAFNIFDKDPAMLWPDSISRLQAPKTISTERWIDRMLSGAMVWHVSSDSPFRRENSVCLGGDVDVFDVGAWDGKGKAVGFEAFDVKFDGFSDE